MILFRYDNFGIKFENSIYFLIDNVNDATLTLRLSKLDIEG